MLEATWSREPKHGKPGNLRVRLSAINPYGQWVNMPDMDIHCYRVGIHGTEVNLKTGSVSPHSKPPNMIYHRRCL